MNRSSSNYYENQLHWNTTIIRKEGFKVSQHLRWQPHGPGRSKRKLIMIEEFQKHGYIRQAKKIKHDN